MTYVNRANAVTVPGRRQRLGIGSLVGAMAITVAAAAIIATGLLVNSANEAPAAPVQSVHPRVVHQGSMEATPPRLVEGLAGKQFVAGGNR